jgi:N-acetylglutamate synthase-like GNAT family acetyltransferase
MECLLPLSEFMRESRFKMSQTHDVEGIKSTIRRATLDDLAAVLSLDRSAPVGHERRDFLIARLQSEEIFISELEGRVLGYAVLRTRSFFGRDFVDLMAVAVNVRRKGVGSTLLERVVDSSSTDRVFTSTNRSNTPMIDLLEKAGWQFSGELTGIDEDDPELVYYLDSLRR